MGRERRPAAVMFTDIEGYTAMMGADEDEALAKLDRYTAVLRRMHDEFGGTVVKFLGDGSLSTFARSADAVACAVAVQRGLTDPVDGVPIRIGVHAGDVVFDSSDVFGDVVNVASRIESFGVAGSVLVSDAVEEQVRGHGRVEFVELGRFRLKNVGRPVTIHAVAAAGLTVPPPHRLRGKGDRVSGLPDNLPVPGRRHRRSGRSLRGGTVDTRVTWRPRGGRPLPRGSGSAGRRASRHRHARPLRALAARFRDGRRPG